MLASLAVLACGGERTPDAGVPESALREEPREAAPGSPDRATVLVLGTSLTAGLGLTDPVVESWPGRLQALADSAGIPVRVQNAGVSGDTSAGGLRRLEWLLQEPADVLVVEMGANDGLRGLDLPALERNLRSMVTLAREANPEVEVVLIGMEAPPNMGQAYADAFREVFPRVAREAGTTLVPFPLDGVAGVPDLNQADAIHPTAEGHARMARNAWPVLEPVFRRAAARVPGDGDGPGGDGA